MRWSITGTRGLWCGNGERLRLRSDHEDNLLLQRQAKIATKTQTAASSLRSNREAVIDRS